MRWRWALRSPRPSCSPCGDVVDLGKSIYLQPTFSAPLMFFGGVLFGYGMVLSNGCGSRALVLLGRGNLRSLVVVIVLGIAARDDAEGPDRAGADRGAAMDRRSRPASPRCRRWSQSSASAKRSRGRWRRRSSARALIIFAFAHAPFQRAWGQIAAGVIVGLLIAAGWYATGYLGADDFNPTPVTSLTFVAPIADTLQYHDAVDRADAEFRHRHGRRRVRRQPGDGAGDAALSLGRLQLAAPHAALGRRRGADGRGGATALAARSGRA